MPYSKQYSFLFETTSIVPYSKLNILEEQKVEGGVKKIKAKALLQEADVRNGNGRIYPSSICESIVNQLRPRAESRKLLMEIGHPTPSISDPTMLRNRMSTTDINNCGAVLTSISLNGNRIDGVFETLSGFKGPELYKLIMYDHVDVGFSLRAFGSVQMNEDGTMVVKEPIKPVTYDIVPNPSYSDAKVLELVPERLYEEINRDDGGFLLESDNLGVIYAVDGVRYDYSTHKRIMAEFLEEILNEKIKSFLTKCISISI